MCDFAVRGAMNTGRMMRRQLFFLLLSAALAVGLVGCADLPDSNDSDGSSRFGLDESISCPEGEVGWRFPRTPLNPNSEEYVLRSGESTVVEITERFAVEVQSATCGGNPSDELGLIRNECGGSVSCRYSSRCGQSFAVTYTCGASDTNAAGAQNIYTATGGVVELGCSQPARAAIEVETRTECVPRECHGRARRDLNMQCVENPSATEVVMEGGFGIAEFWNGRLFVSDQYWLFPQYQPQTTGNFRLLEEGDYSGFNGELIYPDMPYFINLWARFWFGLVPETSSVVVWISDTYKHRGNGDSVEGFRCVAFKRDIEPEVADTIGDDQGFAIGFSGMIATDCIEGGRVSEDNAAKRLGLSVGEFRQQYSYFNSQLRASYDMEGRSVWHKTGSYRKNDGVDFLPYHEPMCAPNPQDFFYDATTGTYDLIAYYAQREFGEPEDLHFVEPSVGRRAYIIPGEIRPRSNLTISTTSRFSASLPVDISWSAINLNQEHPFNPWAEGVDIGGAWEAGKSLPQANFAPTNVRASVFVYPLGAQPRPGDAYTYKIGEIPLNDPNPDGTTNSANLPITEAIKRYFTWSSSRAYIDGDTRLFRLFYCIESDENPSRPGNHFEPRQGKEYYFCPNRDYCVREYGTNYSMSENIPNASFENLPYSLELDTPRDADRDAQFFRQVNRGCRASSVPLRVNIDRFSTPLEPIASSGFTGSTKTSRTGDNKMSADNDNDTEINCTGQAQDNCVEAVNGGNRTDGESARSTYDLNNRLGRNPGATANTSMTAEMLGFQLIDPMDPVTSSVGFPADSSSASSTPVTITLAPDWDGIKSALEQAMTGSTTQWKTGRYGGQMGLGVGWGFIWRWQIGPVPVLVTFTFTVGASVAVEAEFQFGPNAAQQYPCIGTQPCMVMVNQPATFRDAARDCNIRGGRLAELSSQAEASAVDANRGGAEIWLGGQLAYRHPLTACATNFNSAECVPRSKTEYRWMSNSQAFASNNADATPTYVSSNMFNANQSGLFTRYPHESAVVYQSNGNLSPVGVNNQRPYMCAFEPAASQRFFRWQLALNMGAAAGFNLTGCVPSDDPGFCLGAGFNIVSFAIGPVYENVYHWLYRAGESDPFSRRGNTNISVPWSLKLFEGQVTASVNFLWFSISWNLVTYDGITAAEGKLYDADTPVIESLE